MENREKIKLYRRDCAADLQKAGEFCDRIVAAAEAADELREWLENLRGERMPKERRFVEAVSDPKSHYEPVDGPRFLGFGKPDVEDLDAVESVVAMAQERADAVRVALSHTVYGVGGGLYSDCERAVYFLEKAKREREANQTPKQVRGDSGAVRGEREGGEK